MLKSEAGLASLLLIQANALVGLVQNREKRKEQKYFVKGGRFYVGLPIISLFVDNSFSKTLICFEEQWNTMTYRPKFNRIIKSRRK